MRKLTPLEKTIYNAGERLIPGVTHDLAEVVRHRSSYLFFRKVIENDLAVIREKSRTIQIADLGCGVGHGAYTLSKISGAHITGIDSSAESLQYAQLHYARPNISYQLANLENFIPTMPEYDYVVSRGALEHVPNGLQLALAAKWHYRLLFDVPYNEPKGRNPYHVLYEIRETAFIAFPRVELLFQDLAGVIYDVQHKPLHPNVVICTCRHPDLGAIGDSNMVFPLAAWQPELGLKVAWRVRVGLSLSRRVIRALIKRHV